MRFFYRGERRCFIQRHRVSRLCAKSHLKHIALVKHEIDIWQQRKNGHRDQTYYGVPLSRNAKNTQNSKCWAIFRIATVAAAATTPTNTSVIDVCSKRVRKRKWESPSTMGTYMKYILWCENAEQEKEKKGNAATTYTNTFTRTTQKYEIIRMEQDQEKPSAR